jgi:UDP-GlcNAc:undecaprenyl-phosphate/decaprenyl-phosphate GlcNAc-1-phosphate transferase
MGWLESALLPGLVALLVAAVLTPVVRAGARRWGAVARPRSDRWHNKPTALMGGIAIFSGFAAAYAFLWPSPLPQLPLLGLCGLGMFILGLVDDLVSLRPAAKLAGQIVVASVFAMAGVRLVYSFVPVIDFGITVLWLVGITNAINLLDNLDGQAAGVTVIAAGFLTYFFWAAGQPVEAGLAAALAGAALGFLLYNWSPASIFMGDSGSLFLGFTLAGVTLLNQTHRTRNLLATLAVPLLLLMVPILDTALVTLARKAHGRAVSQGGTDHISHRLVALGLSERSTVLVVYAVALASGLMAIFVRNLPAAVAIVLVPVFLGVLWFGLMVVARVRVYQRQGRALATEIQGEGSSETPATGSGQTLDSSSESTAQTPPSPTIFVAINLAHRHQIMLVLFDLGAVIFSYYVAFVLRFGSNTGPFIQAFVASLPLVIAVQMGAFWLTGLYRTVWRHGGLMDYGRLGLSVVVGVAGAVGVATFVFRFELLSRAVFAVDAVVLFVVVATARFLGRASSLLSGRQDRGSQRRALIFGAGGLGSTAIRELRESARWTLQPVALLDDDPGLQGRLVQGVRVVGGLSDLTAVAKARRAEVLLVAIQSLPEARWIEARQGCEEAGIELQRLHLSIEPGEPGKPAEPDADCESPPGGRGESHDPETTD